MSLTINAFGKYYRILRLNERESQRDMAKRLGVSAAFLSAVELGKRTIPINFENKISKEYELDAYSQKLLIDAINQSKKYIKIDTSSLTEYQIVVASRLSEHLKDLNEDALNKITSLLDEYV